MRAGGWQDYEKAWLAAGPGPPSSLAGKPGHEDLDHTSASTHREFARKEVRASRGFRVPTAYQNNPFDWVTS